MRRKMSMRNSVPAHPLHDYTLRKKDFRMKDFRGKELRTKGGRNALNSDLKSRLAAFLRTVAQAPEAVLLLDYDGTLAPFKVERDQAYPYPGVTLILQEIVRNGRTRVVIISGRDAKDVFPLLNIHPRPEIWGIHGLQRSKTDGSVEMPRLDERTLDGLSDADRWLGYQQLRYVAEFKTGSIAIHWRGLDEIDAEDVRARVLLGWHPIAKHSGLDLLEFDGGVEIRARQAVKCDAVRIFLNEISPDTPAAYLGDDNTDESAFLAMRGRGIGVLVRPTWRKTAAQMWLKPPTELLDFFDLWLEACTENDVRGSGLSAAVNG
jgi:trehalose 6-phosphate phosphatase